MNYIKTTLILTAFLCLKLHAAVPSGTIVEWPVSSGGNGHYYAPYKQPVENYSWEEAKLFAENAGGYLATITSQEENLFVFNLSNSEEFWRTGGGSGNWSGPTIGGFQPANTEEPNGGWSWLSGEAFVFTNWATGQPNDAGSTEQDNLMYWSEGGIGPTWQDFAGVNPPSFIVEWDSSLSLSDGLVAHFPFNGNANDESGFGNHLSNEGAVLTEDMAGNQNSAFLFDGSYDYMTKGPASALPTVGSDRTLAVVFDSFDEARSNGQVILSWGQATSKNGFGVYIRDNEIRAYIHSYDTTIGIIPTNSGWHYVVLAYSQGQLTYLIGNENGISTGSTGSGAIPNTSNSNLTIGAGPDLNYRFNGVIDNARIYNRVLSLQEMMQLYEIEFNIEPTPPVLPQFNLLIEPQLGDTVVLDATATSGYPFPTYQWYYNGNPIPAAAGGTNPVLEFTATLFPIVDGVYRCVATNSVGSDEAETRVVLFRDDDNDGLSNYQETTIHLTDPQDSDSDDDGLPDGVEINDHLTNPNDADSDDDGFSDFDEVTVYQSDPLVLNVAWGRYIVGTDNWINTQHWLGWLKVEEGGWLWSLNERSYIWVPESSAETGSGWVYHP
jgi:hypothetical protein